MPVGSSNAEDLASSDEIKVFKDEGEDEKRASADLTDLKSSLITESDQEKSPSQTFSSAKTSNSNSQQTSSNNLQNGQRPESTSSFGGKPFEPTLGGYSPFGYPLHPHSPYHPHNGTTTLGQMANKVASMVGASSHHHSGSHSLPFMMPPNMETRLPQPPPAHMGIPPVHIETKAVSISAWMDFDISNIARNPLYNLSGHGQYSHSVLSDLTQQFQWPNPAMYQLQSSAFRNPYTSPLSSVSSATFPSFVRNPPIMPHPSLSGHSFTHPSFLQGSTSNNLASDNNNNNNSNNNHNSSDSSKSNRLNNGKNATSNGNNLKADIFASGSTTRLATNSSSSSNANSNHHHRRNSSSSNNNNSLPIENSFSKIKMENGNDSTTNNDKNNIDHHCVNGSGKLVNKNSNCSKNGPTSQQQQQQQQQRQQQEQQEREMNKMHIKKPLNAFMIYMKEMRAKVIAESTLKESAAINQILGKRWHEIGRDEQEKYYDKARKERELHMEMHPGWTAKDNYAINGKRKKKKRERNADGERGALKKCRARYGLDQQNHWCKPCRRKKKCIRYLEAARAAAAAAAASASSNGKCRSENESDNFGSVSSVEAPTPESKSTNESDHDNSTMNHLMSSTSNDLSLSSPSNSEYNHFMSTFNHHFSSSAINSPPNHAHLNLSVNNSNGTGGHHLPTASPLFYPHHNSSSSPIGSRVSSLLTPHSPLTSSNIGSSSNCYSSSSSSSSLVTPSSNNNMSQSQVPPRSSPFSIEQLARPHCPQSRSLPLSATNIMANHGTKIAIAQLPTPPSSTDSTGATPAMLSVA